jgi:hypothetical protein
MRAALLFLLASSSSFGQPFFKGGLSLAHTSSEPPSGVDRRFRAGFTFGFVFIRQWTDKLAFKPEISFIQKGERITTSSEELKVRLNYVEAPTLFVLSLMKESHPVELLIQGGPSFGYGLGGNFKVKSPGNSRNGAIKFGTKPSSGANSGDVYLDSPVDIGLQFGLIVLVRQNLMFDFRYGHGLTSFIEPPSTLPPGAKNSDYYNYNRTIQVTVGWRRPGSTP